MLYPGEAGTQKSGCYLGISAQSSFSFVETNTTWQVILKCYSFFTCKIAWGSIGGLVHSGTLQTHKLVSEYAHGASVCQYDLFAQNKIFSRAWNSK